MKLVGGKFRTDKSNFFYIMGIKLLELAATVMKVDAISRYKQGLDKFMNNWFRNR